jgi:hypothetical protein
MTPKKVSLVAFLTGVTVACLTEIVGVVLDRLALNPGMWWSTAVICVFPPGVALIETSNNVAGYIFFVITALLNGLIYMGAGLVGWYCLKTLRELAGPHN